MKQRLDQGSLFAEAVNSPEKLADLVRLAGVDRTSARYTYTKIVRRVSENKPDLVYPHFDAIASWLDQPNSFVRWDAILTLANLAQVDAARRLDVIKPRLLALLDEKNLVTAGNLIGSAWKIAAARPDWEPGLTRRFLDMPQAEFLHHGQLSPECTRVACGHVLDYFSKVYGQTEQKESILYFAREQAASPRPGLARKAQVFLRQHTGWKAD
jgi:hypothetical protein